MYNLILKQNSGKREEDFELSWVSVSGFLYSIQLQTWYNGVKSYLNEYLFSLDNVIAPVLDVIANLENMNSCT